ncbi:MAG: hypothetical protein WBE58_08545 [Verrucomicrobiales bacterium]
MKPFLLCLAFFPLLDGATGRAEDFAFENAPIHYSSSQARDPLARLGERIQAGEPLLRGQTGRDVLHELLALLNVPEASQVLVYSKTSAQNDHISPDRPRAVYFSENAYVGWVQGGKIEVITLDPDLGAVFYLVNADDLVPGKSPTFERHQSCLNCHAGGPTAGTPGPLVRSVYPSATGLPYFQAGSTYVDHSTPIADRWGGWYVTGNAGGEEHRGNCLANEEADSRIVLHSMVPDGKPVARLDGLIETKPYLGGGRSDIVALMVLEHQVHAHNTLLGANMSARQAIHRSRQLLKELGGNEADGLTDSTRRILKHRAEAIVKCLLFADEQKLPVGGIQGGAEFEKAFLSGARQDPEGRSLRDLRLYERLFKNRCSYTIYSDAFTALVPELKTAVFEKLLGVLNGTDLDETFADLGESERDRILEILRGTLPDLPQSWHQVAVRSH